MNKIEEIIELDEKIVKEFDILDVLGRGAYGVVWKVRRKTTGEIFALKKVFEARLIRDFLSILKPTRCLESLPGKFRIEVVRPSQHS